MHRKRTPLTKLAQKPLTSCATPLRKTKLKLWHDIYFYNVNRQWLSQWYNNSDISNGEESYLPVNTALEPLVVWLREQLDFLTLDNCQLSIVFSLKIVQRDTQRFVSHYWVLWFERVVHSSRVLMSNQLSRRRPFRNAIILSFKVIEYYLPFGLFAQQFLNFAALLTLFRERTVWHEPAGTWTSVWLMLQLLIIRKKRLTLA